MCLFVVLFFQQRSHLVKAFCNCRVDTPPTRLLSLPNGIETSGRNWPLTVNEENSARIPEVPALYASDPNDQRYSARHWLQNIRSIPRSTILREIKGPVVTVMAWSLVVSLVHKGFLSLGWTSLASRMCLDSKPHSYLVSALGLLLVFRTNSAYQKFAEGRLIWERILSISRNMSRMAILYEVEFGLERRERVFRLLAAFPYLLHYHIQEVRSASTPLTATASPSATDIVARRQLPWSLLPTTTLEHCAKSNNRPLWVCDRMSQEVNEVEYTPNFTSRERLTFLSHIDKLSQCIGECERIHQTAVPLNYARHSLRSLTLWLFTLPFTLIKDFGILTCPIMMGFASWLLYGIYQIGFTIEDPFQGSLRLSSLCDAIFRDVMVGTDIMDKRMTAFSSEESEREEWKLLEDGQEPTNDKDSPHLPRP